MRVAKAKAKPGTSKPQTQTELLSIQATPDISGIRTAELIGNEYTIVPCIALCEGVLWPANAPHPELALAEEFGRFPEGWNGRPLVMNHPVVDGQAVSASHPDVLENYWLGQIFNTQLDGDKLKTELWIDTTRVATMSQEVQDLVQSLIDGTDMVEVSTGLFTMQELVSGEYDGEHYDGVWRNVVPDHLALLSKGTIGACSIADGCGAPRTNNMKPAMKAVRLGSPAEELAPIISTHDCECGGECDECKDKLATNEESLFKRLMKYVRKELNINSDNMSDSDIRQALTVALEDTEQNYVFIMAVYESGNSGKVIYEIGWDGGYVARDFTIDSSGVISLGSSKQAVRPVTQFVPVEVTSTSAASTAGEGGSENNPEIDEQQARRNAMNKEQLVRSLIANEATRFTDADTEMLMALDESVLERLMPAEEEETEEVTVTPEEPAAAPATNAGRPTTAEEYINSAPEEIRSVLSEGIRMQRARRSLLIEGLLANSRNKFSKAQLEGKGLEELEMLAELAETVTYEGRLLGNASPTDNSEPSDHTPAPNLFEVLAKKTAA